MIFDKEIQIYLIKALGDGPENAEMLVNSNSNEALSTTNALKTKKIFEPVTKEYKVFAAKEYDEYEKFSKKVIESKALENLRKFKSKYKWLLTSGTRTSRTERG